MLVLWIALLSMKKLLNWAKRVLKLTNLIFLVLESVSFYKKRFLVGSNPFSWWFHIIAEHVFVKIVYVIIFFISNCTWNICICPRLF